MNRFELKLIASIDVLESPLEAHFEVLAWDFGRPQWAAFSTKTLLAS